MPVMEVEYTHGACNTVVAIVPLTESEPWAVYAEQMADHKRTCKALA